MLEANGMKILRNIVGETKIDRMRMRIQPINELVERRKRE